MKTDLSDNVLFNTLGPRDLSNDLTATKANSVIQRGDWQVTGFMLTHSNGEVCIVDKGAVRWLTTDEWWQLMHTKRVK